MSARAGYGISRVLAAFRFARRGLLRHVADGWAEDFRDLHADFWHFAELVDLGIEWNQLHAHGYADLDLRDWSVHDFFYRSVKTLWLTLLLFSMACAKSVPIVPPPVPDISAVKMNVNVSLGESVNQQLLTKVNPRYTVTGTVPPGLKLSRIGSALYLVGTATQTGAFEFSIQ